MIKLKVVINNDRKIPMRLRVQCGSKEAWECDYYILQTSEVVTIEFEAPEETVPYFKIWEDGSALLGSVKCSVSP